MRHFARLGVAILALGGMASATAGAGTKDIRVDGQTPVEYAATHLQGAAWAVVVGIDAYRDHPNRYAVSDARAVAQLLGDHGYRVVDLYDRKATRQAILAEWLDKLPAMVQPHDRVVIYFAGHSVVVPAADDSLQSFGYLLPVDADPKALGSTAISTGVIKEMAGMLKARHVLFLFDACLADVAPQMRGGAAAFEDEASYRRLLLEPGREVLAACGEGPGAREEEGLRGGVFTHYLRRGLEEGLADDGDGLITALELFRYVGMQTAKENEQRPMYWRLGQDPGGLVFLRSGRVPRGTFH